MSYREFRNEKYYERPEYDFDNANKAIAGIADAAIARKQAAAKKEDDKVKALATYKYEQKEGKFDNDIPLIHAKAAEVYGTAKEEITLNGNVGNATQLKALEADAIAEQSQVQYAHYVSLKAEVEKRASNDEYFMPNIDLDNIEKTARSNDFTTRGDKLKEIQATIGGIKTFNKGKYLDDFIEKQQVLEFGSKNSTENSSGVTTGSEKKFKGKYITLNSKGEAIVNVKDEDINEYLTSEPRVKQYYENRADEVVDDMLKKDAEAGILDPVISAIKDPAEQRDAYALAKKISRGKLAKNWAKEDLTNKAYISADRSSLKSIDHTQANKVEEEKVTNINTIVPLASIYETKDKDGKPVKIENHFPVIGQSFFKGKAGDAKPITANISINGATALNIDPNSTSSIITNNNRAEVQMHGSGRVVMIGKKRLGTIKPGSTPAEQASEIKRILTELSPEDRKRASIQHVYYGKAIDKTKIKGDGVGSERKQVKEEDGTLVTDANGKPVYEDQYDAQEVPFIMNATQEADEIMKKASKGSYDPHDPKKWSKDEKEIMQLAEKLGVKTVDSRTVRVKPVVRKDNEKRTYRNDDPNKPKTVKLAKGSLNSIGKK